MYVCAVVWEKFTIEYFHMKIVHVIIFQGIQQKFFNKKLILGQNLLFNS